MKKLAVTLILIFSQNLFAIDCVKRLVKDPKYDLSSEIDGYTKGFTRDGFVYEMSIRCGNCSKSQSDPKKISQCLMEKIPDDEKQYKDLIKDVVRVGLTKDQSRVDLTPQELDSKVAEFFSQCPDLTFNNMKGIKASTIQTDLQIYGSTKNDCIRNVLCTQENVGDVDKCLQNSFQQSQFSDAKVANLWQTKIIDDVVNNRHLETKTKPKIKAKAIGKSEIAPISQDEIIASTKSAAQRKDQLEAAQDDATKRQMGCPKDVEYKLKDGESICIKPTETRPAQLITHMDQLEGVVNEYLYKDISAFVAKRIWESYSMALLMDPKIQDLPCEKGEAKALSIVSDHIGADAFIQGRENPAVARAKINKCFKQDLNLGNRVEDLAKTAYNMSCKSKERKLTGPCAKDSEDKGKSKSDHIKKFARRAKMLGRLKKKLETLRAGNLLHDGKKVTCGKTKCEDYIDNLKECLEDGVFDLWHALNRGEIIAPQRLAGCPNPNNIPKDEQLAFSIFTNFNETRNMILTKNPELAAKLAYGENGEVIEVWESIDPDKKYTERKIEYKLDDALRKSRQQKLDLVLDKICGDPKDFAQSLLLSNPSMINEFMKQSSNPNVGKLLCVGLSNAEKDKRTEQSIKAAVNVGIIILGAALALPTGGASMVYGLTATATAGAVGLTINDLKSAVKRMEQEKGMFHGCLSEYDRLSEVQDELDDAVLWAAIDFGLAPTAFLGLSSLAKAKELKRIAQSSKAASSTSKRLIRKLDGVIKRLEKTPGKQRLAIARDYDLKDFPGLISRRGRLTKDGRKTVEQIQELERMGFSKSNIDKILRSCN